MLPLAHHALLLAIPFVVPAVVIGLGLLFLAARERAGDRGHSSQH